jgi:hypothetical protein
MSEQPIAVFVHVPKTAGTTFRIAVEKHLGPERILWDYGPDSAVTSAVVKELLYAKRQIGPLRKAAAKFDFVSGHFNSMQWRQILPDGRQFAFLRDPVQRVVSLFNHLRTHDNPELNKMSLYDWVAGNHSMQADNHQVRIIGSVEVPFGKVGVAELERAKSILDSEFDTVGITERFDESFLLIRKRLGWDGMFYVSKNKLRRSVDKAYELDERTVALIRERNKWDIQLYEYAAAKLDRMIQALGEDFSRELEEFRQANVRYQSLQGQIGVAVSDAVTKLVGKPRTTPAPESPAPAAAPEKPAPDRPKPIYRGRLQQLAKDRVVGWAMNLAEPEEPVAVELLVNGALVRRIRAKGMRKGLLERQVHPTGLCGFMFKLADPDGLKAGDVVLVRVQGSEQPIAGSPQTFSE